MDIVRKIQERFIQKKLTLSLAESCTGGALSAALVSIPDSSRYFLGSLVAYSGSAKESILGVPPHIIKTYGEVSAETAREMALGALNLFNSDVAVAITGIAGPGGGSEAKPVGTVFFALLSKKGFSKSYQANFSGNRQKIIFQSVEKSLLELNQNQFIVS